MKHSAALSVALLISIVGASSTVFLNDGEKAHQIAPFYKAPNGVEVVITNDIHLDCVLSILDLPQGSADLIDILQTKGIGQLLNLPKSVYGNGRIWTDITSTKIPPLVLLQLLDDDRYQAFESSLLHDDISPHMLLNISLKHLSLIVPDYDLFPNRRLLTTIKKYSHLKKYSHNAIGSTLCRDPLFFLVYATPSHFVDWGRVFYKDQVAHLTDDELKAPSALRSAIVRGLCDFAAGADNSSSDFADFLECFIFEHKELPSYGRFERCLGHLTLDRISFAADELLSSLQGYILVYRNELLFKSTSLSTGNEQDFVGNVLERYYGAVRLKDGFYSHLMDKIIQYKEFITPAFWRILGAELQTMMPEPYSHDLLTLVLVGYFLGYVDLLPQFVHAIPFLADLPASQDRDLRLDVDPGLFIHRTNSILGEAIDLATFFDPEIQMKNHRSSHTFICLGGCKCLSAISCLLARNKPLPTEPAVYWNSSNFYHLAERISATEPFKSRIYPKAGQIPRNYLWGLVERMGFELVYFLDVETRVWFLEKLLMSYRVNCCSSDLLHMTRSYFPLMVAGKEAEWAIKLLGKKFMWSDPNLKKLVHLMVIEHFDVTNVGLFSEILGFGRKHTVVFVKLFKKIRKTCSCFDVGYEAMVLIRQIRPGLLQWLDARFEVVYDPVGERSCLIPIRAKKFKGKKNESGSSRDSLCICGIPLSDCPFGRLSPWQNK